MQTWRALSLPVDSLERIDVPTLHARRDELQVLDVRERQEWDEAHIPGSVHVPYHDVTGIPDGIDPSRPVAVICASGQRSAVAASLLALHGAAHVIHVAGGGVGTWQRNGWPVTHGRAVGHRVTRLELPGGEIVGIRAANPGPFTLSGTNSWIVGRDPAWLVDPGPALDEHLAALDGRDPSAGRPGRDRADPRPRRPFRGGAGASRRGSAARRSAAARGEVDVLLKDGSRVGPFEAVATPGHAPDHLAYVIGDVALTGDAVLGEGSVFISPDPGALAAYLDGLAKLRGRELSVIGPGTGRRSTIPQPSSTSTSRTGSTASGACSRRSTAASAASTSCSTRSGATRRRAAAGRDRDARRAPGQARRRRAAAGRRAAPGAVDWLR